MIDNNSQTPRGRIPVRFVDEEAEGRSTTPPAAGDTERSQTPGELGRASSYEDATEMKRRVDRGAEPDNEQGRSEADEQDIAGGPPPSELPQHRNEQDTTRRAGDQSSPQTNYSAASAKPETSRSAGSGSALSMQAELFAAQAELSMVEADLKKAAAERQELQDLLARRQADFDNYRKRIERERAETYHRAIGEVVKGLLPVVDNLRRAIDAEGSVEASESEEFRHFLHGVELINKQLNGVLENLGLEAVATTGQRFDPHVHEAIAAEPTDEFPPDTVTQEIVRGYRLGDKLLRPAMVKVSTKQ